jgi:hypothetical protein
MANPGPATSSFPNYALDPINAFRLLASYKGLNVNATGDTQIQIINLPTTYSVFQVVLTNASISLTTAAAGLFTAPSAGGTAIVANAALSGLTGSTVVSQRTVASTAALTSQPYLYFNVGTAQGAAATVDLYIYGFDFSNPSGSPITGQFQ